MLQVGEGSVYLRIRTPGGNGGTKQEIGVVERRSEEQGVVVPFGLPDGSRSDLRRGPSDCPILGVGGATRVPRRGSMVSLPRISTHSTLMLCGPAAD
jgi:hypothetical protein